VQQPVQNASTEEDRQRNAAWDQYWRDAKAAYLNADYRHHLVGIIREYKNKGIDTGYMDQAFDQPDRLVGAAPFGGWQLDNCMQYMTELCQLRELAYHVMRMISRFTWLRIQRNKKPNEAGRTNEGSCGVLVGFTSRNDAHYSRNKEVEMLRPLMTMV
jgi:hypothetical protein